MHSPLASIPSILKRSYKGAYEEANTLSTNFL